MGAFDDVAMEQARPLPVIVLADVSGSMAEEGKLDSLKHALVDMIKSFQGASSSNLEAEIWVGVYTFGGNSATRLFDPMSASAIAENEQLLSQINSLQASGGTPLGHALTAVADLLENKEQYPSRAYRPFLVLASDGMPNDEWEGPLDRLLNSERGKKATRLALSIGADADDAMLKKYIGNEEIPVIKANNVDEIKRFFKCVTMSAIKSSQSAKPGQLPAAEVVKMLVDDSDDLYGD